MNSVQIRAATANHTFQSRTQKGHKDNDLSALKQFASDQLTLIAQKEYASQMNYMDQLDEQSNFATGLSNHRGRLIGGRSEGRAGKHTAGRDAKIADHEERTRVSSVYTASKKSAKEKLQNQFYQSSNGFHKQSEQSTTSQLKRFGQAQANDAQSDVRSRPYDKNMQKQQLCRAIRDKLRKELWYMFRSAEQAYASLDFSGLGYITEQVFLDSKVVQNRVPFSRDEIKMFFREQNLFAKTKQGMEFDTFKKYFFPHLYLVQDDVDDADDKAAYQNKRELQKNKGNQPKVIEDRVVKLETKLKTKFSNCFESVRKAFLALDTDYDGIITVEDILKYFGNETDLNYNDLKKLINDKDSKKQGKLGYMDFSKWLGNAIHMSEGFYFRHDSIKNPQYEGFLEKEEVNKAVDKAAAQRALMTGDIETKILEKIKFQWKTLRKAFMDLNIEKTGRITRREFKFYLNFWGMDITDEEFEAVYNKFDLDKDGVISYKDFQVSIGSEMFPAEGLYFRQDKPQQCKTNVCQHNECWQPTKNNQNFCVLHQKMHADEAIQIYTKIFKQLGSKWNRFIEAIKKYADPDDESQISFELFSKLCDQHGANVSTAEKKYLLEAFPGMEGGDAACGDRINVARIYDQKYSVILGKMYNRVNVEGFEGLDEPMDPNGYLGKTKFYRPQIKSRKISAEELVQRIAEDNRLKDVMRTINEIDKDHNGYVTATELDDILKLYYPDLEDRDLVPLIKKFSSIQNRILIDYKGWRDWIKLEVSKYHTGSVASSKGDKSVSLRSTQLKRKIQMLEQQVEDIRQKEETIEQNIRQHSDNLQGKDALSRGVSNQSQGRPKSCLSGQRPRAADTAEAVYRSGVAEAKGKSSQNLLSAANLKRTLQSPRTNKSAFGAKGESMRSHRPPVSSMTGKTLSRRGEHNAENDQELDSYIEDHLHSNQSSSKYVSINKLMKKNLMGSAANRHLGSTQLYSKSGDVDRLDNYNTITSGQQGRSSSLHDYKPAYNNLAERRGNLKYFREETANLRSEDSLKKVMSTVVPTDDRTMRKILSFAQNINQHIDDNSLSPQRKAYNSKSNAQLKTINRSQRADSLIYRKSNNESKHRLSQSDKKYGQSQVKSILARSKFEKLMVHKLGYEWKNIYRGLSQLDTDDTNIVSLADFTRICEKFNVSILKPELQKIKKLAAPEIGDFESIGTIEADPELIDFKKLSILLGLHKESYNYFNQVQTSNRIKTIKKLRTLYKSIESPTARNATTTEELKNTLMSATNGLQTRNQNHKSATGIQCEDYATIHTFDRQMQSPYANALNRNMKSASRGGLEASTGNLMLSLPRDRKTSTEKPRQSKLGSRYIFNEPFLNQKEDLKKRNKNKKDTIKINLKDQVKFMSKRYSYNGKQKDVLYRIAEAKENSNQSKTTDATEQYLGDDRRSLAMSKTANSIYDESVNTHMDDGQVAKILQNKQKLKKFRDMVIMFLKKNDLSTQIIQSDLQDSSSSIILSRSHFKQCLNGIGAHLSNEQLNRFNVKGDIGLGLYSQLKVIPEATSKRESEPVSAKSSSSNVRHRLNKTTLAKKSKNLISSEQGQRQLGYDVQKFISYYL